MTFNLGPYEVGEMIGSGGTSTVYRGIDSKNQREVAIKLLSPGTLVDDDWKKRIHREIATVISLDHPNIVPIIDSGQQDDLIYIVMPFYEKDSLETRLKDKRLSPTEGAKLFNDVASALDYVHGKGIVHRDIKPGNILFDNEGNALLADFGLVQLPDASVSLTGSAIVGTPKYISPEQARGDKIDGRSDQYSLGVILYELLTGEVPFSAETPIGVLMKHITDPMPPLSHLRPNLAGPLEQVILKATAKNPQHRFESVGEFNQTFQAALKHAINPDKNPAPEIHLPDDISATYRFPELQKQQALEATAPPPQNRWRRWAALGTAILIVALACPFAISAASTLFGSTEGLSAAEATALDSTLAALSTKVAAGASGDLGEDEIQLIAVQTLSAEEGVSAEEVAQLDAIVNPSVTPTPGTGTAEATNQASEATATEDSGGAVNSPTSAPGGNDNPTDTAAPTSSGDGSSSPTATTAPPDTPVPSPTATDTQVVPPTATETLVPSATFTNTPTQTQLPTATEDVCSLLSLGSFSVNNKTLNWSLVNNSGQTVTVDSLTFNWPGSNGNLKDVKFGAALIWTTDSPPPSLSFGSIGQSLASSQQKAFVIKFVNSAASSGYSITVNLSNGCQVIASE
ncbi:MAG: serine/threonine protein kinase [Chloroflexi bacterium]|nr:MAG: serine/threonine protein kinase [Chloroflexota bacterium]MBL1195233.1 serine/threonine protein kinase [Chloroflexota bacterium]NOH12518.1 protein kinase [Chloroflexota bacterium]